MIDNVDVRDMDINDLKHKIGYVG